MRLLELIVPTLFLAANSYFILVGKIPVRGRMVFRENDPGTFWTIIIFFSISALAVLAGVIFPNWSFDALKLLGLLKR